MKILWIFFSFSFFFFFFFGGGGHHKIRLYLEGISMHFRVFSEGQGTKWRTFLVAKISNIYLGCLKFLIFFWGEQ